MTPEPTIIIDTREQRPLSFATMPSVVEGLDVGDYSIAGLQHLVACERKSLPDLVACCGSGRERFVRELERLQGRRFRCVVVEASLADIERAGWRGNVVPNQVLGSIASWSARYGLPFFFCGDHGAAGRFTERWLYQCARCIVTEYTAAAAFISSADGLGERADGPGKPEAVEALA